MEIKGVPCLWFDGHVAFVGDVVRVSSVAGNSTGAISDIAERAFSLNVGGHRGKVFPIDYVNDIKILKRSSLVLKNLL